MRVDYFKSLIRGILGSYNLSPNFLLWLGEVIKEYIKENPLDVELLELRRDISQYYC